MTAILAGIFWNRRGRHRPDEGPTGTGGSRRRRGTWLRKGLAVCLGLTLGLVLAESGLRVLGIPRFYKAHSLPSQFFLLQDRATGRYFYVNKPAEAITFAYDSNPRGYFKPGNIVVHQTNRDGFRGPEFSLFKPANTVRIAFIGDSFTFGEGVHFDDTFANVTGKLLTRRFAQQKLNFECYNFGVGGYNTADELFLLQKIALQARPDIIVLCFVLNDAEPELFEVDPVRGPVRRSRENDIPEGRDQPTPPKTWPYELHLARLAWQFVTARQISRQTEAYYRALYRPDAAGWRICRNALDEFVTISEREKIPLVVMIFPVLHRLDQHHPFQDLYATVAKEVETHGGHVLNLFPAFEGNTAEKLWVYPTDQHPNEIAHRIAAERLAEYLATQQDFRQRIEAAK